MSWKLQFLSIAMISGLMAMLASPEVSAQESEPEGPPSPWLLTPLLSVDPKLGTNVGGLAAYLRRFDDDSPISMMGGAVSYSNTDSLVSGMFADLYWGADHHRFVGGAAYGNIKNEYDDFLGTGRTVETVDDLRSLFLRYRYRFWGNWFIGGQLIRTNYQIDFPPSQVVMDQQVGYLGFNSTGAGLVLEMDGRNHIRTPTEGNYFLIDTVSYHSGEAGSGISADESQLEDLLPDDSLLGRDGEFDVLRATYSHYSGLGHWFTENAAPEVVLAIRAFGRWTNDAPLSGFSSVSMPGYTRGNYLGENYSDIQFDLRMPIGKRWGVVLFGGIGCLYGDPIAANESSSGCSENAYPGVGAGISWLIKPESGVILRAEAAKGTGDNSALYLRFGHPF